MDKPITTSDGYVINPEDKLYFIMNMSDSEISRLADNLNTISKFFKNEMLKQNFILKISKLERGITALERKLQVGDYKTGVRKSIQGQENNEEEAEIWPSLSQLK
jgi:hypothetical protein